MILPHSKSILSPSSFFALNQQRMENEVSSSERKLHWDKFSPSAPQEVQETMYQAYQTTDGGRTGHGIF